ncbi:MAG TPA: hypothetical protein VMR62_12005 [Bryobacteraceae bacterium]|jgi:hypothetical protein|nr:hypothetical protein [Bryobacteraceae bacterium]
MRSFVWLLCLSLGTAAGALAGLKPVAFRLASLPASAEPGQKLVLCAANIGTGSVDVTLEFINVKTGGVVIDKTVSLEPLGAGTASQPCVTTEVAAAAGAQTAGPMASSFAASGAANGAAAASPTDGEALLVGVAMVRKSLLSFREAQVTASIQVMAPDADGVMRTVQTIPLSRAAHPSDGAPVNAPASSGGHHK